MKFLSSVDPEIRALIAAEQRRPPSNSGRAERMWADLSHRYALSKKYALLAVPPPASAARNAAPGAAVHPVATQLAGRGLIASVAHAWPVLALGVGIGGAIAISADRTVLAPVVASAGSRAAPLEAPRSGTPLADALPAVAPAAPGVCLGDPPAAASVSVASVPATAQRAQRSAPAPNRPPPRTAALPTTAPPGSTDSALDGQRRVIEQARVALSGGAALEAQQLLAGFQRDFPQSQLAEEAEFLGIQASLALGDGPAARASSERFRKRHPQSLLQRSLDRLQPQ